MTHYFQNARGRAGTLLEQHDRAMTTARDSFPNMSWPFKRPTPPAEPVDLWLACGLDPCGGAQPVLHVRSLGEPSLQIWAVDLAPDEIRACPDLDLLMFDG